MITIPFSNDLQNKWFTETWFGVSKCVGMLFTGGYIATSRHHYAIQDDLTQIGRKARRLAREIVVGGGLLRLAVLRLDLLAGSLLFLLLFHFVRHEIVETDHIVLKAVNLVRRLGRVGFPLTVHIELVMVIALSGNLLNCV